MPLLARLSITPRVVACAALLALAPLASAATGFVDQATIVNLQAVTQPNLSGQPGAYFVYINLPPGGPSCATYGQTSKRFVVNPNTEAGMSVIATLLAAQASGRNIQVTGSGLCDIWSDTESIVSVFTE